MFYRPSQIYEHIMLQCIDGATDNFCHTAPVPTEPYPWIAVDLGSYKAVKKFLIYNRAGCCGDDLRDLEVRVSNTMPGSASEIFTGGSLLGNYDGWGNTRQVITVAKDVESLGRYVVVQHNARGQIKWLEKEGYWDPSNGEPAWAGVMDIAEVKVFGGKIDTYMIFI